MDSILKISNSEVLFQFLHSCIDDLAGKKPISFENYTSEIEWTQDDFSTALNFTQTLYREGILTGDSSFLDTKISDVRSDFKQCFKDVFEIRKADIYQAVIKQHLAKTKQSLVENIDWKLKWVVGSSKLATLRKALLQVDLHCFKNKGDAKRNTVNFEMNLVQVDQLIAELEKVQSELNPV